MDDITSKISKLPEEKKKLILEELLKRKRRKKGIPLSFAQQRLWMIYQMYPQDVTNNILLVNQIDGKINIDSLKNSLACVLRRHEILRTRFTNKEGRVYQVIEDHMILPFKFKSFINMDDAVNAARKYIISEMNLPFVLEECPLIKFFLCQLTEKTFYFVTIVHHIVFDGWSTDVFANEVFQYYQYYSYGKTVCLPELKQQYRNYAFMQDTSAYQEKMEAQLKYWLKQLEGISHFLPLNYDHEKRAEKSHHGKQVFGIIDSKMLCDLKKVCDEQNVTMFMFTFAVFAVLLNQYTSQNNIFAGVPFAGRTSEELETMIGFFVNIVIVKVQFKDRDEKFLDLLHQVSKNIIDAYENQEISYHKIIEKLCKNTSPNDFPFAQVMFNFQNTPICDFRNDDFHIQQIRIDTGITKSDFSVEFVNRNDCIQVIFEYNTELFEEETIKRMLNHYMFLLSLAVHNVDCNISELPMMQKNELALVTAMLCGRQEKITEEGIIPLFEHVVKIFRDRIALICADESMTYQELNEKSDQVFRYLQRKAVYKGDFVGLCMDRSIELYICLIGILKLGAVYVPINPNYSEQRISYMIEDSHIRVILMDFDHVDQSYYPGITYFFLNEILRGEDVIENNEYEKITFENIFYLMYTSGSTGSPKGVLTSYRNAMNRFQWMWNSYKFCNQDVVAFKTSINFVDSIWEIFGGLLKGIPTVIIKEQILHTISLFVNELYSKHVTRLVVVPSLLKELLNQDEELIEKLKEIHLWISSGETLSVQLKTEFYEKLPEASLLNLYGSTEVMADVAYYETDRNKRKEEFIPIGKLIYNVKAKIVDRFHRQVPIGVRGKLLIEGAAVTKGYYHSDELNSQKFLNDGKVFDTGDEVSLLADGNLRYHSRLDQQLKVHGARINLTEINKAAQQHFLIKQAFCVIDDRQEKRIILFVTVTNDLINEEAIFKYLMKLLPSYMLPEDIIIIERFPELPNGKIDQKALLVYETKKKKNVEREEMVKTEDQICMENIWTQVLEVSSVRLQEHFFTIGGNSLKAMNLISDVLTQFGIKISLKEFYENDTIEKLCQMIQKKQFAECPEYEILPSVTGGTLLASSAQKRIYLAEQMEGKSLNYNLPFVFTVYGKIDLDRLEQAFQIVLEQNEILRTAFLYSENEIIQKIYEHTENHLVCVNAEEETIDEVIHDFIQPFDLSKPNLIRLSCVCVAENKCYVLLDMHHIISDGKSIDLFFNRLIYAYKHKELSANAIQYKDYVKWQYTNSNSQRVMEQEDYWLNKLSKVQNVTTVPADHLIGSNVEKTGAIYYYELSHDVSEMMKLFEVQTGLSKFILFLSALGILLRNYGNKEDIIIETPIDMRQRMETRELIGNFINIIPIKITIDPSNTIYKLLLSVRESVLDDMEHKEYPYEELVKKLELHAKYKMDTFSHVMLAVHNNKMKIESVENLRFDEYFYQQYASAKYDITFNITDKTKIYVEYCKQRYSKNTVINLMSHLVNIINYMIHYPLAQVKDIQMLSDIEFKKIVYEFNQTLQMYPHNKTYSELFDEAVVEYKDNIAIYDQDIEISYFELMVSANKIARNLQKKGICMNKIVVICLERTYHLFEVILGVLKSGAAYVPVDPTYPTERIKYILKDSNADAIITDHVVYRTAIDQGNVIFLQSLYEENKEVSIFNQNESLAPAYIIYTSGSTGNPKGVVISHRSLHNFINGMKKCIAFYPGDRILCCTTISFDIFVLESLLPLSIGCSVVLANSTQQVNLEKLCNLIVQYQVNKLQMIPVRLQAILNEANKREYNIFSSVDTIMIGGEAFNKKLVSDLKKQFSGEVFNMYGPTETTVWSSVKKLDFDEEIVLGRPIANTQIYLLNEYMKAVPYGVEGSIYIGGDGLSNGYLNQGKITKEKFISNPFVQGQMIYDTGDIGKWTQTGELLYIGRKDLQIKVGGHRIECTEVEGYMDRFPGIKQSVVAKSGEYGESVLCGYYITEQKVDEDQLRDNLLRQLPSYMVPSVFVNVNKFPMTPNNKIDRKLLKLPDKLNCGKQYVAANNEIERNIVELWQEILGIDRISIDDNFFHIGGNSLLLMEMHSRLTKLFPNTIEISDLFAYPSVRKIASFICEQGNDLILPIVKLDPSFYEKIDMSGIECLSFELDIYVLDGLNKLCKLIGCRKDDIYIAILVYSLACASIGEEAGICLMDEKCMIQCVEYDFKKYQETEVTEFLINFLKVLHHNTVKFKLAQFEEYIEPVSNPCDGARIICMLNVNVRNMQINCTSFDLVFTISQYEDVCKVICEYDTSRLNADSVRKLLSQLNTNLITLSEIV